MKNYEQLKEAGVDTQSLINRLMGNEALVGIFIKKFTEDKNFTELKIAFAGNDAKAAEMKSHTLKGMCGNLSLTRLYELFSEQVSLIRKGELESAANMMTELENIYDSTLSAMISWLNGN